MFVKSKEIDLFGIQLSADKEVTPRTKKFFDDHEVILSKEGNKLTVTSDISAASRMKADADVFLAQKKKEDVISILSCLNKHMESDQNWVHSERDKAFWLRMTEGGKEAIWEVILQKNLAHQAVIRKIKVSSEWCIAIKYKDFSSLFDLCNEIKKAFEETENDLQRKDTSTIDHTSAASIKKETSPQEIDKSDYLGDIERRPRVVIAKLNSLIEHDFTKKLPAPNFLSFLGGNSLRNMCFQYLVQVYALMLRSEISFHEVILKFNLLDKVSPEIHKYAISIFEILFKILQKESSYQDNDFYHAVRQIFKDLPQEPQRESFLILREEIINEIKSISKRSQDIFEEYIRDLNVQINSQSFG